MKLCRFEFGAFGPLHVRREKIALGISRPISIVYASDLHLGHWWTRCLPAQLIAVVAQTQPSLVLLGGDLVDHHGALPELAQLVRRLNDHALVAAIPGNHDHRAGSAEVRDAVLASGGRWLPSASLTLGVRIDAAVQTSAPDRPRVLCCHDPSIFPRASAAGYGLTLAGHLHGGQCVLATHREKLYPAAWLHRWHGLRFRDKGSLMLVSRGLADTLPVRFNCPREILLCDLV